ncbi:uncharacterized protein LOC127367338 [Dicentrarchus labrax]|uniref:uncharacterized protein LOC127367338 n=1 Tax=Dicentrarchus labrax TaxID=13489 RepID=UPI0021F69CEC|nr:uncharacterized protein LOC127367338 [Dicentrarchus labrax]
MCPRQSPSVNQMSSEVPPPIASHLILLLPPHLFLSQSLSTSHVYCSCAILCVIAICACLLPVLWTCLCLLVRNLLSYVRGSDFFASLDCLHVAKLFFEAVLSIRVPHLIVKEEVLKLWPFGPLEEDVDRLKVGAVGQLEPRNRQQHASNVTCVASSIQSCHLPCAPRSVSMCDRPRLVTMDSQGILTSGPDTSSALLEVVAMETYGVSQTLLVSVRVCADVEWLSTLRMSLFPSCSPLTLSFLCLSLFAGSVPSLSQLFSGVPEMLLYLPAFHCFASAWSLV